MSAITMDFGRSGLRANSVRPRLRLTARGRAVLTTVIVAPLAAIALVVALNGGGASASLEGGQQPFEYVTVQSGDTLWQLAQQVAPQVDPREVIEQFVQFNQLSSPDVYAGQELAIPAQYTR
jgi:hypothetical protein